MTCRSFVDQVEAIAAGDLPVDAEMRAHLESCPACASALAAARRIEMALAARFAPAAPAGFEASVMQRIRHDYWRAEQQVDRAFNLAIAAAVILVGGGLLALLNLQGVMTAAGTGWTMLLGVGSQAAREAAPTINTYIAAGGLLVSALVMWWWADRTLSF